MHGDESDLFRREMADVQPIREDDRAELKPDRRADPGQAYRRHSAQTATVDENFLSTDPVELVDPLDILSFRRDGIQHGVFRRLKQGGYPLEATLDLHRLSLEEARAEVFRFIHDCLRFEVRTALISHGKGMRSKTRPAVLKTYVARWLPMFPEVMAFHSAQNFHGGVGSVYVMIRKSRRQKDLNRQRFERRR